MWFWEFDFSFKVKDALNNHLYNHIRRKWARGIFRVGNYFVLLIVDIFLLAQFFIPVLHYIWLGPLEPKDWFI
ncbi:MAG: hypothetical protein GF364_19505 [Candidatus Lokiarchaeota archaeon]|nr:hypothetical protein [Candidatus Lokiarchaeota archaeon]